MKAKEIEKPNVIGKFQIDIALVSAFAIVLILRLVRIGLIFITSPGTSYNLANFFVVYPLLAIGWGCLSRPLHFPLWETMVVGLVGFGAGLFFWSGLNSMMYVVIYLVLMLAGFYIIKLYRHPEKQNK
jgi:hypothetical protein